MVLGLRPDRRFGNLRYSRLGSLRYGGSVKMRPINAMVSSQH
jgi:hypothetical protein